MAYDIPLQDGKPVTKLHLKPDHEGDPVEDFGYQVPTGSPDYGSLKATNLLPVSENPKHAIYWQEYGNPKGEPVMILHGGPGGGGMEEYAKFFDPAHYRIIVADQRGCGHSEPTVATDPAALTDNDTPHLIEDIEKLRAHLKIRGKMHVAGGSWGSTLSLAYAIEHPENVKTLQLRGIFLGKKNVFDYFYQGNAATYDDSKPFDQQDFSEVGAYRAYMGDGSLEGQIPPSHRTPTMANGYAKAWDDFVRIIPADERFADGRLKRSDMVAAYSEIFEMQQPLTDEQKTLQLAATKAWTIWEGTASNLNHDVANLGKFEADDFAINFARIENRYFMHGCYLGMKLGQNPEEMLSKRDNNFIMENLHRLKGIEYVGIIHGGADQVTLPADAKELAEGLTDLGVKVRLNFTPANHSAMERPNAHGLVDIGNEVRDDHKMTRSDYELQPKPHASLAIRYPGQTAIG